MKKIEEILNGIVIIFLSIHLFTVNSKLLFHLNPDKTIKTLNYSFSLELFNSDMLVSTLSALAYSLITALILAIFVKYKKVFLMSVIAFAILDGIGVFVYYNIGITKDLFVIIGSCYYALYTIFIIVSLGMYRNIGYNNIQDYTKVNKKYTPFDTNYSLEDNVMSLDREGWSQTKIAKELNISQPKVSRTLKKLK